MSTRLYAILCAILILLLCINTVSAGDKEKTHTVPDWNLVNAEADWDARAGLQVLYLNQQLFLLGGRTPRPPSDPVIPGDSDIWGDVWTSMDLGKTWEKILDTDTEGHWPARAYFQAVTKGEYMYVLGGQNFNIIPNPDPTCLPPYIDCPPFISASDFFNDVWASNDGINWTQLTEDAGWAGRAGLSSVVFNDEIYVLGGSFNDDPAVIGGPPVRVYFNDVWKSADGINWVQLTDSAAWAPRAGAIAVVKNDYIYLLGGEFGFLGDPPPYFNDVWRSKDGSNWELVTEHAAWSARPGHQCVVLHNKFVLFGGFGLPNPMDIWTSKDGKDWKLVSTSPWNALSPLEIKYDFDALVLPGPGKKPKSIYTFGGDRETFDFTDPTNYLNIDNDVWRFAPRKHHPGKKQPGNSKDLVTKITNFPNPFNPTTTISYQLEKDAKVTLRVLNITGQYITTLINGVQTAGSHSIVWNGTNSVGRNVASGIYLYQLNVNGQSITKTMNFLK